jgi:hypothetical protein
VSDLRGIQCVIVEWITRNPAQDRVIADFMKTIINVQVPGSGGEFIA